MKHLLTIFFSLFLFFAYGQIDSTNANRPSKIDTSKAIKAKVLPNKKITIVDSFQKKLKIDSTKIKDSLRLADSTVKAKALSDSLYKDSLAKATAKAALPKIDTSTFAKILAVPYLPFSNDVEFKLQKDHRSVKKDELFYILLIAFLLTGFIKIVFPKYFNNMFSLFFQTSLRSKQTREQLLQNKLASLLMNSLFFVVGGIYVALIVELKGLISVDFWRLTASTTAILTIIYTIKFLFIQFSGWVFNNRETAQTYNFIVFLGNKIMSVALLPCLTLLAFSDTKLSEITFTVSIFIIILTLLYRYLISLNSVRKELNIPPLHFFLYLCSVEVLPLLIIYKAAFNYIGTSI